MTPKSNQETKVRIEGNIENDICSTTWVDPKTVFEHDSDLLNQPIKAPKSQKLSQRQMSEFRESQEMKVVQLHEWFPKQFLNPTSNPKIAH